MATTSPILSIEEYLRTSYGPDAFTFDSTGLHEADGTNLVAGGAAIRLDLTEAFAALD